MRERGRVFYFFRNIYKSYFIGTPFFSLKWQLCPQSNYKPVCVYSGIAVDAKRRLHTYVSRIPNIQHWFLAFFAKTRHFGWEQLVPLLGA